MSGGQTTLRWIELLDCSEARCRGVGPILMEVTVRRRLDPVTGEK